MYCLRVGRECHGWLLFQATTRTFPSDIPHTSFKIFNHEANEPRQVQTTWAKIYFGFFFFFPLEQRNTLETSEFLSSSGFPMQRSEIISIIAIHWTVNLQARSWLKLVSSSKMQISAPMFRCGRLLSDDCTVLCHVAWRSLQTLRSVEFDEQWPHFIFYLSYLFQN